MFPRLDSRPGRLHADGAWRRPRRDFGPLWFTIRYAVLLVGLAAALVRW